MALSILTWLTASWNVRVLCLTPTLPWLAFAQPSKPSTSTNTFHLERGQGVPVCEAYKTHLERYARLVRAMACGDGFFDRSGTGISAPRWQRLDLQKYSALYERISAYEVSVNAKRGPRSKREIELQMQATRSAAKSGEASMWLATVDLESDGSVENIVLVQRGSCLSFDGLEEREVDAGRALGIDLRRRLKQPRSGGVVYIVNKQLTDVDRANHERVFGTGPGALGLFQFKSRPYIAAYDAIHPAEFFRSGRFTVMALPATSTASVCEIEYRER